MSKNSEQSKEQKKPSVLWWLFAVFLILLFMLVKLPAAWVLQKFLPQQTFVENINGNLYQGQAQIQLPAKMTKNQKPVTGVVTWKWRAWEILWITGAADITLSSGNTKLNGKLGVSSGTWQVSGLSGKLSYDLLQKVLPMEFPNTDVTLANIQLKNKYKGEKKDWLMADGQITWAGGEIGYVNMGKTYTSNLPAMKGNLSLDKTKMHLNMLDSDDKRMGDIFLDADGMVDVQLTQRLLLNVKGYKGNAALDTAVVSVRQPLSSIGK